MISKSLSKMELGLPGMNKMMTKDRDNKTKTVNLTPNHLINHNKVLRIVNLILRNKTMIQINNLDLKARS